MFLIHFLVLALCLLEAPAVGAQSIEELGFNCTAEELVPLSACLQDYNHTEVIVGCDVQCSVLDEIPVCFNAAITAENLTDACAQSIPPLFKATNEHFQDILFNGTLVQSCSLNVTDLTELCPNNLTSIDAVLPGWSEWNKNSSCSVECGNGTMEMTRSCVNTLSFRMPPEAVQGCEGNSTEMVDCMVTECSNSTTTDGMWGNTTDSMDCNMTTCTSNVTEAADDNNSAPQQWTKMAATLTACFAFIFVLLVVE